MKKAIKNLSIKPDYVLIDFEKINLESIPLISIRKADRKSIPIANSSILAKVSRDEYMVKLSNKYPQYFFNKNKGYRTKIHIKAINELGIIKDIHKTPYKPIKIYLKMIK